MKYRVLIRRNGDGVERWTGLDFDCLPDSPSDADLVDFMWCEGGNYSCDCNRSLFFHRVVNEPDGDVACGDTAYDVVKIERQDGAVLVADGGRISWNKEGTL